MIIFAAVTAAVLTFLLAVIATAVSQPLTLLDESGGAWTTIAQVSEAMILVGPIGLILLGIFVASGARATNPGAAGPPDIRV